MISLKKIVIALPILFMLAIGAWALVVPRQEHIIGSYITSLEGRTPNQIHNANLAAKAVNNIILMPGQSFSFVKSVGSWTADKGYKRAPVSYDGELVNSWGGGVCQTSTTLYNAALLSGMKIIERHRHHWPARYAPLGRDAAVAYMDIDLKFKNILPKPVKIIATLEGNNLICSIMSEYEKKEISRIETNIREITPTQEIVQDGASGTRPKIINRGHPGFNVQTYRITGNRSELISKDQYPAMSRVVRIGG